MFVKYLKITRAFTEIRIGSQIQKTFTRKLFIMSNLTSYSTVIQAIL